jgi:hypothetical protein
LFFSSLTPLQNPSSFPRDRLRPPFLPATPHKPSSQPPDHGRDSFVKWAACRMWTTTIHVLQIINFGVGWTYSSLAQMVGPVRPTP